MLTDLRHGGLTTMWALFTFFLNWEVRRELGFCGAPGWAYTCSVPTSILYTPVDNAHLHSIPSV